GERRAFQNVVVEVEGTESVQFTPLADRDFSGVSREAVTQLLAESGLWTSFRTRPYSKVPSVGTVPRAIFVQAIDTNPLAVDPRLVIHERERDFQFGLQALSKLTDGKVYVCRRPGTPLTGEISPGVQVAEFEGPHPAGLPGTHIHFLSPVGPGKVVWHLNYQDVLAIGHLVVTGQVKAERVISVAGPGVTNPQVIRTVAGACIRELTDGQINPGPHRIISGSVLSGRVICDVHHYLGRFHLQVSAIADGAPREFLGWMAPGGNRYSIKNVFLSALSRGSKRFAFSTSTGGSKRAMVPIGTYESVMPLDILPTFLLRALITGDTDRAQQLGCLELDEEDLALCTFVCPGKYEYGPILRDRLTLIEKEG
ncbi:MAG: Na(+)-translocating NADH-quinone reductase subunit A, partial [Planctomycetaceae bacterium]|nr:Na(+)-translocating NADH-quinone reductase subunit A [Planctomycetaceae bacterium]